MVVTRTASPSVRSVPAPRGGAFATASGVLVPVVGCDAMRLLEQAWMTARGAGPVDYARLAGERLAVVAAALGERPPVRVTVVVGGGWNGLAGMQAAITLACDGHAVTVVPIAGRWGGGQESSQVAALRRATVRVEGPRALERCLSEADVVVDAIVGCGLAGRVRPWLADAIRSVNALARRIVAADVPSGLHGDSGRALDPVVRPTVTLAFGLPKVGLLDLGDGPSTLLLADLRLPRAALAELGVGPIDPFHSGPIVRLRPVERRTARLLELR